ncbi:hypothetical protein K8O68_10415 [Salipaludibacillus sp. CUR1]|uniref:hypothetical protein n=1 Tax=Salipaludibacillus sp. CUR1 TaxID=2820003 RepID=UPI001E3EEF54|nr:hypothetical protein [Salipaludibacillus sp. CUR1]MCE7792828.1 hypothetical protein [Salipaludibacillus sp. CUR1]
MKYWLIALGWGMICFSGGPFMLSMMREEELNMMFFMGGLMGIIFAGFGLFMKKKSEESNPFFK